jgi:hypothetical protein
MDIVDHLFSLQVKFFTGDEIVRNRELARGTFVCAFADFSLDRGVRIIGCAVDSIGLLSCSDLDAREVIVRLVRARHRLCVPGGVALSVRDRDSPYPELSITPPDHARTRPSRCGCNSRLPWAGSPSLCLSHSTKP